MRQFGVTILMAGLLAAAFSGGLSAATGNGPAPGWQSAYDAGVAALEAGEVDAAIQSFEKALDAGPEGVERVRTLYILGAASFRKGAYDEARQALDDIIALYDAGAFDDRKILRDVLERAAAVAYRQKDEAALEAYQARRKALDAQDPAIWKIDNAAGLYTHRGTGTAFPEQLAGFTRQGLEVFRRDGSSVAATYAASLDGGDVDLTFHVTENYPLIARQHFDSAVQSLRARLHMPRQTMERTFAPWGADGPNGFVKHFTAPAAAMPTERGLWIVADGNTHYTIEMSYASTIADPAQAAVERFVETFDWPARQD